MMKKKSPRHADTDLSVVVKLHDSLVMYVSSLRRGQEFDINENGASVKSTVT